MTTRTLFSKMNLGNFPNQRTKKINVKAKNSVILSNGPNASLRLAVICLMKAINLI
jgi:hypothetical protein